MCAHGGRVFTLETEVRRVFLAGIQKLTLLDYPGKVACTVFTAGCDLRCPFCHNASLALPERESDSMELDDLLAFLRKRQGILDGVAVTGGEPLMHPGIVDVLGEIKALGYSVKLDTNGTFPKRLREIVEAKLADRVAMDIKAAPENYGKLVGIPGYDIAPIRESAEYLTTAVKGLHTRADFEGIAQWIAGAKEYYIQEFKDSGDLIAGQGLDGFTEAEMHALAEVVRPLVPSVQVRGI